MFVCLVFVFYDGDVALSSARRAAILSRFNFINRTNRFHVPPSALLPLNQKLMKVGRNNFRPPPKVESRVVRIVPLNPAPEVNFVEWDGMVRLLFNRKNKTIYSVLNNKSVYKVLSENYVTHNSMSSGQAVVNPLDKVKDIVREICEREEYKDKRVCKMDIDELLVLLELFNRSGIHFC